jgi:hypothetical protein
MSEYDISSHLSISQCLHEITEKTRQHPNMHILLTPLIFSIRSSALHVDHFVTYLIISNAWTTFFQEMLYHLSENLLDNMHTCVSRYQLQYRDTYVFIILTRNISSITPGYVN